MIVLVVVLDCSLVLVLAGVAPRAITLLRIFALTVTERANTVDDDDEDDDENDRVRPGYCVLQQQISPSEENIDSSASRYSFVIF